MKWVGKTRSVRIATDEGDRVYHSLEDVPADLRQLVKETLEGPNSETVLIANQEAYERLTRQFRELPAGLQEAARSSPQSHEQRTAARLWRWGIAGSLSAILALWALWTWVSRSDTW